MVLMWKCSVNDESDAPDSSKRCIQEYGSSSCSSDVEPSERCSGESDPEVRNVPFHQRKKGRHGQTSLAGSLTDDDLSITIEPEVLDCSVCWEPLLPPVFQCKNGHTACSSCCLKLKNSCHVCSMPIGYTRCIAIEKVIESIKTSCRNSSYGCKERITYFQKYVHEENCIHAPCMCPISNCSFLGSSKQLLIHLTRYHEISPCPFSYNCPFHISFHSGESCCILCGEDGLLFAVHNSTNNLGSAISVASLRPLSSSNVFAFYLMARSKGRSLSLKSFTTAVACNDFLLVPSGFASSDQLMLDICIWRAF